MARTGRPPKPVEEKRRIGNPGHRPLPTEGSLAIVPATEPELRHLTPAEAMERVLEMGVHWLGNTDSPQLALAREALEDYAKARATGDIRLTIIAREQVMKAFSRLGFDPESRSRLGLAEVKAKSVVEEIIDRRRSRSAQD